MQPVSQSTIREVNEFLASDSVSENQRNEITYNCFHFTTETIIHARQQGIDLRPMICISPYFIHWDAWFEVDGRIWYVETEVDSIRVNPPEDCYAIRF